MKQQGLVAAMFDKYVKNRILIVVAVTLALIVPSFAVVGAAVAERSSAKSGTTGKKARASQRSARRSRAKRKKRYSKRKVCRRHKGKRRCRWVAEFQGHSVSKKQLRSEPLPRPSGDLHVYAVNFREELRVNIYDEQGEFDEASLAAMDQMFRCRRSKVHRAVDPHLYEILSIIYERFGRQRVEIISGFRRQPDRETSRHFHASAMDIRVPGVSTRTLYEFATTLDTGGMGIGRYPNSDFVHVDFRAPGEKSYRWVDYSPPDNGGKKRKQRRKSRRTRPNA